MDVNELFGLSDPDDNHMFLPPGPARHDSLSALLPDLQSMPQQHHSAESEFMAELAASLHPGAGGGGHDVLQSAPVDWGTHELLITKHSVHGKDEEPSGATRYLVSNLKFFEIGVLLQDRRSQLPAVHPLRLRATLLYEDTARPLRLEGDEAALLGNTELDVVGGKATFRLKFGKEVISSKHEEQRFRVRIEPVDTRLVALYPNLALVTEPLKSMTKLPSARKPKAQRAAALPASPDGAIAAAPTGGDEDYCDDSFGSGGGASADGLEDNATIREMMAAQRAQIKQLQKNNAWLLEEISRLNNNENNTGGSQPHNPRVTRSR